MMDKYVHHYGQDERKKPACSKSSEDAGETRRAHNFLFKLKDKIDNMNTTNMVQQQPDGSTGDGDGDNNFGIGKAKALTTPSRSPKSRSAAGQSTHNIESTLFRSSAGNVTTTSPLELDVEVAYSSPTPFDVDNVNDNYEDNSPTSPLRSLAKTLWVSPKPLRRKLEQVLPAADSPTYIDLPDDVVVTPTTPLSHDHHRASSSCSTINHSYDVYEDNDNDEKTKLNKSDITKRSESDERCLPGDTFSFFVYSDVLRSRTFYLALVVFLFQMAIYFILAYDITNFRNPKNRLKLPVNVEIPVRIAECFAIMVAIITQDEVGTAVVLIREGFDEDLVEAFPGATKAKWVWSIALRAFEGLFGLLLTCLLIMQSTTVLDLLLNFLAMEFVSKLDDVVFVLAREGFLGFLGCVVQKEADNVSNTYYASQRSRKSRKNATCVTNVYFLILFTSMFTGWVWISWKQASGAYLCSKIFAQHGDEALPMLGSMSGLFLLQKQSFIRQNRRLGYKDNRGSLLAYCEKQKRWTLSLSEDGVSPDDWTPCNWYAASSESEDFDVLKTATSQWVVKTSTNIFVPLSHHFLACYDCTDNLCAPHGYCKEGKCMCKEGRYGLRCEYPEPCQRLEMEIEQHDEGFVKTGESYFASKYYRLQDVETYNRPVYTSLGDNETTLSDDTDFFVFTGARWILSYRRLFPELKDVNSTTRLAEYFKTQFRGHSTKYSASYVSEPVYIDTPADAKVSPLSVRWRYSALDNDQQLRPDLQKGLIETSFFCAYCDEGTNPCPQGGAVCLSDGTCGGCPKDSSGTMCQIPSKFISNGQCDSQFNNITFGFDGGDCCENTCRSTPENTCGKAGQGYIDTGYPLCVNASNQWELSGGPIDGVSSGSRSGVAVALSGKGKILAVADAGVSIVRLFDKEGSKWIERSQVQGPPESNFGMAISLSHEFYNSTRNPWTYPTVTLAVGAPKLGLVRVFKCATSGCMQRGEDIVGSGGFGNSLSISKDGNSIAIGGADRESISIVPEKNTSIAIEGADNATREIVGDVKVFTWSKNTNEWQQKVNVTIGTPWSGQSDPPHRFGLRGYYVSLSGDYLAVGTLKGEVTLTPVSRFESVKLITQVYKWDESAGWNQLGDEIEKNFYDGASFGAPWPLKSVVIKGSTLAVSSNSSVDVYSWNEASRNWIPREVELANSSSVNDLVV